jgi:hypothetical protein
MLMWRMRERDRMKGDGPRRNASSVSVAEGISEARRGPAPFARVRFRGSALLEKEAKMSAKDVLRVREEARPLAESVHVARRGYLLLDAEGRALVRVIEKGQNPPVSLLMVHSPGPLEEERYYANLVAAYVRLGVEQFLDERRKDAENGALALSVWDEGKRQAVLVTASESHWGVLSMSRLFPWPWPVSSSPSRDEASRDEGWLQRMREAELARHNLLLSAEEIFERLSRSWLPVIERLGLDGVAVVLHVRRRLAEPDPEARGLTLCAVFSEEARKRIGEWMDHLFPRWQVEVSPVESVEPLALWGQKGASSKTFWEARHVV